MPELSSPWRELVAILIGGGAYKIFDLLLRYVRQRSDLKLAGERAEGESLERRVKATVQVIDIYQESSDDFAERIRELRADNRKLKRQVKELQDELLLCETKRAAAGRVHILPPGPPAGKG